MHIISIGVDLVINTEYHSNAVSNVLIFLLYVSKHNKIRQYSNISHYPRNLDSMISFEYVNLTILLVIILIAVAYQHDAAVSMSTPYNDSIERYRNLMLMNGPAFIYNENRDKRQILQENNMNHDETLLITCYLTLLTIFGISMNGYAIYRTTKVRKITYFEKINIIR